VPLEIRFSKGTSFFPTRGLLIETNGIQVFSLGESAEDNGGRLLPVLPIVNLLDPVELLDCLGQLPADVILPPY
jgi:hypothetical protein